MNTTTLETWAALLVAAGIVGLFGLALRASFREVKRTSWIRMIIGVGVLLLVGGILGLLAKPEPDIVFIVYGLFGLALIIIPIVPIMREKRKKTDKSIWPVR